MLDLKVGIIGDFNQDFAPHYATYARNVMGIRDAMHAEYDASARTQLLVPLTCSLAGKTLDIELETGSRAEASYAGQRSRELYYCSFGLNPAYRQALHDTGLRITGWDDTGEVRVIELPEHPFFVATLFVPQPRASAPAHPLVASFVRAVTVRKDGLRKTRTSHA